MDTEGLGRADKLFHDALDRPAEERAAFLEQACAGNVELRGQVEKLLEAHTKAFAYFDDLGSRLAASSHLEVAAAHEEIQIGSYRTLREIGQGGMGTVYLAERADGQFDQRVALKLVRLGMDSPEAMRRFLAERQILARLQHPHIARLLDGGVTEDGRPYFVMEYVAGTPIVDYCDRRRLPLEARLRLLCAVGEAVQYAHRNLVVHRDLKPGNILVTEEGTVKLLDFGIAKVLGDDDGERRGLTRTGVRPMTPIYAAPEQFRGEAVTTATDVFALGVILYELLTGRGPHARKARTATDVERAVLEEQAEPPSAVVGRGEDGFTPESVAAARSTTPARLVRSLKGDADTICLMALRKEPERRYQSAEQLVEDLRRHLAGLPVTAHKDTLGYRASKFVRRHRLGVAAAAAFLALTLGFAALMAVQSARTARERDKAERVAGLLVNLFRVSDPAEARGGTITAREVLDRGVAQIDKGLDAEPEVQARLMAVMGRVYQSLGLYDKAGPLLERSLEIRRRILAGDHPDLGEGLTSLGDLLRQKGDYARAEPLLREAVALHRRIGGKRNARLAESLNHLGKVLFGRGEYVEAEAVLREALAANREALGAQHPEVGETLNNLAAVGYAKGDDRAAEPLFREALAIRRRSLGEDHPLVAATLNNLASLLSRKGDYSAAEQAGREALALYRKLHPGDHPRVATALNNLALVLFSKTDYAGAEPLFRESLAMRRTLLGAAHPDIAQSSSNLGLLLQIQGHHSEAEVLYREALAIRRKTLGKEHALVAQSLNNLGLLLQARGQLDAAREPFREALAMLRKLLGERHALVATSLNNLASLAHDRSDPDTAERLYGEALAIRRAALRQGHPETAYSLVGLGKVLAVRRRYQDAEPLLREGLEIRTKALPQESWETADAQSALGACLADLGRYGEAEPLLLAGYKTLRARRGEADRHTREAQRALVRLYDASGRREEADRYRAITPKGRAGGVSAPAGAG